MYTVIGIVCCLFVCVRCNMSIVCVFESMCMSVDEKFFALHILDCWFGRRDYSDCTYARR